MEINVKDIIRPMPMTKSQALSITRDWVKKNTELAYRNSNHTFSILLLLAIIDCFAQAEFEYTTDTGNESIFCDFVLGHAGKYSEDLKKICPITLYYDYYNTTDITNLNLQKGRLYPYNDDELSIIAQSVIEQLPEQDRREAIKRHQYVHLLYRLRSKLVHELNVLGTPIEFVNLPTVSQGVSYESNGSKHEYWTLNFPKKYIFNLTKQVIYDRLNQCEQYNMLPFPLSEKVRRCERSWYDTPPKKKNTKKSK